MRRAFGLILVVLAVAVVGCKGSSEPDEAKLHKELGGGPPDLSGMAKKPPRGAKQPAGDNPGAAAPGATPPAAGN